MATTRKPAAKKTTAAAKKTTTRKRTTTPRKKVVIAPREIPVQEPVHINTEEQRQAKLEAYNALSSAGLHVPKELATEVEGWVAEHRAKQAAEIQHAQDQAQQHEQEIAEANQNGPWYVRNCYPANFNLRLDRQTEKRRIELKPRGKPGDMHPLKDEDLKDPVLKQNLSLGLIEIIPAGEASIIMDKQTTNMSNRVHTPLAVLRNELDQVYKPGAVKVEAEFNSQGVTVAQIDQRLMRGEMHDREIGGIHGKGALQRVQPGQQIHQAAPEQATSVVRSGFVPTGGNPASVQYGPHSVLNSDAHAKAVDDLARRRGGQGPAAGLGEIQVVVEPVRRT